MSYPKEYLEKMWDVLNVVEVKDSSKDSIDFEKAIIDVSKKFKKLNKDKNKIIFIGNGGSAGIASHQSADYTKNGQIPTIAFHDPSLLTCLSNDYGYEHVYEKPIEMFAFKNDILIAISSSGKSKNILKAVVAAKKKGVFVITMSGFSKSNPLRKMGDLNFYVPSSCYGHVEIIHLIISHSFIDMYMNSKI